MEPFLIASITTSLVTGFVNSRNAEKSRQLQASQHQEIAIREQERIKTQERIEILRVLAQRVQQQEGLAFQSELAELNREFQAQENLLNRNLQLKLAELNQEFQSQQGELSRAFSEKIELFRADLQQYFFEQQRELQLELKQQDIDLARELRQYDRQTAINVVEEQKRQNSSPIWLVAGDLLKRANNTGILPLNVFFSPPVLKYDRSKESTDNKGFPAMEQYLQEELRKFFQKYQTSDSFARRGHRQIDYLAGAWTSKQFNSEAAARQIFLGLKSEPTLILESALEGENLSISFAYWGLGHIKERYQTLMSFSWLEVLYGFVKQRTETWFRNRAVEGSSEAEWVEDYGEDFVRKYQANQAMMERERRWLERGEDIRELVRNYNLAPRDWDELKRFVALCHCAIAGWVTDEYFLLDTSPQSRQQPLLPELLPELLSGMSEAVKQQFIDTSVRIYQGLYQGLISDIPDWEPELRLELAACLLKLSSHDNSIAQINAALKAWLSYRGVDWQISTPVIPLLAEGSQPEDESYFDSLYEVWQLVGITDKVDMGGAYYRRGEDFLKRQDYQAACEDFERAIALGYGKAAERREMVLHLQAHSKEEALKLQAAEAERQKKADDFYNGGIYHLENSNYERSIVDFEQAQHYGHPDASRMIVEAQQKIEEMQRQKKADDFYNGGIYHLENGNYERSIADFEQAQSYGHSDASRMIVEVRHQQDMAVLAKQLEEQKRQCLEQEKRKIKEEQILEARCRLEEEEHQNKLWFESQQSKEFTFEIVLVNSRGQIFSKQQKQACYFTEYLPDGSILDMVLIPRGKFMMGCNDSFLGGSWGGLFYSTLFYLDQRINEEKPQHEVTVSRFHISKYPITVAQWRAVASLPKIQYELPVPELVLFNSDRMPAYGISWYQAMEFCDRLSQLSGRQYRLPSEAEWEYACRAGTTTPFYFGETITTGLANYNGDIYLNEPKGKDRKGCTEVDIFPPNAFGLYDMHGNIDQWCADTWHENYIGAPIDGTAWMFSRELGGCSPLRGGYYGSDPRDIRSTSRRKATRGFTGTVGLGFRVVCVK